MMAEFYHVFRLPDGRMTPGQWDLNQAAYDIRRYVCKRMNGRSVLDVGCRDGWYSLLFASNGARVTALDIEDRAARRMMAPGVPFMHRNVYYLRHDEARQYDYCFTSDMLIHCEHPMLAIRAMSHVARACIFGIRDGTNVIHSASSGAPWYNVIWDLSIDNWLAMLGACGLRNRRYLGTITAHSEMWGDCDISFFEASGETDAKAMLLDDVILDEIVTYPSMLYGGGDQ